MEPVKPVFWYQGLFLQPQHFQQYDVYFQSLLKPLFTHLQPYFWGVYTYNIQEASLANQTFVISRGEFLFQDGTWISIPGNTVAQSRNINKEELEAGKPFKVYLGLRKWDHHKENVSILENHDDLSIVGTRFISGIDPENVKDIHQGGKSAHVKLLQYVLKVFWENETDNLPDYHLIPVAELVYDEDEIILSRDFIPPVISVASSDALQQILHNIREQITSRCRKLEEYKSPREMQTSEIDTTYIIYLMALRSLNRYVPLLHHMTETPDIHPWTVYGLIRQIIGELSTFTNRIDSLGKLIDGTSLLSDYDHENLRRCYDEAQTLVGELLSAIVIGPENIIRLIRDGYYFKAQIPQETFEKNTVFYLGLRTAENQSKVLESMKNIAKVSSSDYMMTLVGRALPGISLEYSLVSPPGLPTRPNSYYFKINQSDPQWVEIQKSQDICLYWQHAPKDTQADIIVLRK